MSSQRLARKRDEVQTARAGGISRIGRASRLRQKHKHMDVSGLLSNPNPCSARKGEKRGNIFGLLLFIGQTSLSKRGGYTGVDEPSLVHSSRTLIDVVLTPFRGQHPSSPKRLHKTGTTIFSGVVRGKSLFLPESKGTKDSGGKLTPMSSLLARVSG